MTGDGTVTSRLERLEPGQVIVFGGDRTTTVPADLAAAFSPGDRLVVVQETGALLHVPAAEHELASRIVFEVGLFSQGQPPGDDRTLVILKVL